MAHETTAPAPAPAEWLEQDEDRAMSNAWESMEAQQARQERLARSEALEHQALYHAQCDDAASACWYLCRSLGLARQLEPAEPNLELLFELIGALADLPAEICSAPLPPDAGGEQLGISELCQQLAMAREQTQEAWVEAELAAPAHTLTH